MGDRSYLGIPAKQGVTVRYLHFGDSPLFLIPTLRTIWTGLGRDSHHLAQELLAEDWSFLTADQHASSPGPFVPGIGRPSWGGTRPQPALIRLNATIGADIGWLYVLNPDIDIVTVYEATVHDRWLRHSLHLLDPVQELFVSEPGLGTDEEPAMTVCAVCGAVNEVAYHEVPSMAGSGHDTCTICQRCGSSVTTDPMFGAHVTRNPWPPEPASTP
jgi:hypothetical protein